MTSVDLVGSYAARLHPGAGGDHHVASPLGCWLLLALSGTAATGPVRDEIAEALGTDPDTAAEVAAALLGAPHGLVLSAAALWLRGRPDAGEARRWLAGLPPEVATGDLPDQADADAWAREHTLGLIERFPLQLAPDTMVVLATALATKVTWAVPFELAPAAGLGAGSDWAARLRTALRTPESGYGHRQFIAATTRAGDVAVHVAEAGGEQTERGHDGLAVVSVVAAPDVPQADVLAVAHEIAAAEATGRSAARRSLFDMPLGETPLWTLSERADRTTAPDGREERCVAILPAWSARSEHDLRRAELGFPAAARALADLLGLDATRYQAKQSAVARYTRVGFEAAAVSGVAVPLSYVTPRDGVVRVAELRFGHPYAVVAVATQQRVGAAAGPWHGLPVFSAWVADPDDA